MVNYSPEVVNNLVNQARERLDQVAFGASTVLNDLFSGREPGNDYLLQGYFHPTKVTAPWVHPEISANLFQTRLREIVVELIPDLPKFQVKAMTGEASSLEEDQNYLSNWGSRQGDLKQCIRDVAMYGPMGTHVGVRIFVDENAPLHKRFRYKALSHTECGYEPGLRRFVWHCFTEADPKEPEQSVDVTEVFFPDDDDMGCTMYRFEARSTDYDVVQPKEYDTLGDFVKKKRYDAACPVRIRSFLTAPPGEDIAPVECMSWVPLIRAIQDTLEAIDREVNSVNNVILFDEQKIAEEEIADIVNNKVGNTIYIPVRSIGVGNDTGVSHVMRPVERRSALAELVGALDKYTAMLDDVIGTSALNRGAPVGPRKSAAEASILSQASSRRTRDRLSVIAELLADIEQAKFTWQQIAYGKEVKVPIGSGLSKVLRVPDPKVALMNFQVDVVELGNLSKQGQIETYAAATSIIGSTLAQFQGNPPSAVKESLRRYLHSLGADDISKFIEDPVLAGGPKERYIEYLKAPYAGIAVDPNDPPEPFLLYYTQQMNDPSTSTEARLELNKAIRVYQSRQQEAQAQQAQAGLPTAVPPQGGPVIPPELLAGGGGGGLPVEDIPLI